MRKKKPTKTKKPFCFVTNSCVVFEHSALFSCLMNVGHRSFLNPKDHMWIELSRILMLSLWTDLLFGDQKHVLTCASLGTRVQ